ncbi:hypothetical protein DRN58_00490, partial [Thermococci archaeon]
LLRNIISDREENIEKLLEEYVKKLENINIKLKYSLETASDDIEVRVEDINPEKELDSISENKRFFILSLDLLNPIIKITAKKRNTRGYTNELDLFFDKIKNE